MIKKLIPRPYFVLLLFPYVMYGLAVSVVYLINDGYMAGGSGGFEASGFTAWFVPLTVGAVAYAFVHGYILHLYNRRYR